MSEDRPPTSLRRYTSTVLALGVAAAGTAAFLLPMATDDLLTLGLLAVAAVLSIWVPLRIERKGHTQGFTVEEGVFVALLLTVPAGLVAPTMVLAAIIGHGLRRPGIDKIAFNVGQVGLWTASATVVYGALEPSADAIMSVPVVGAVAVSVAVANLVSLACLGELFRRLGGRPWLATFREAGRINAVTAVGNTSFGLILAVVASVDPWATVLASTLMVGLYLGYRGYAGMLEERRRTDQLHDLTRVLVEATTRSDAALEGFAANLIQLMGAGTAEIVLVDGARRRTIVVDTDGTLRGVDVSEVVSESLRRAAPVRAGSDAPRTALAAPLIDRDETIGAIAVLDRRGLEPWDDTDLTLLATVANEAAVALKNVELFRQVEQERARWEAETAKLADIMDATSDGITLLDPEGRIVTWNRGMAALTGLEAHDVIGRQWYVVLRLKDSDDRELLPDAAGPVGEALRGRRITEPVDLQVLRRDGEWRWIRSTFAPVLHEDATPGGTVLVARDVTAEREVEELKADFIATVSHELRTPLTPIKGFLTTLGQRSETLAPQQIRSIHEAMNKQVNRLEFLISDLLVVSDLERGDIRLTRQALDLGEVTAGAVEDERPVDGDRLDVDIDGSVGAVGDPAAVRRIVRAIVSNALKHTNGAVHVRVESRSDEAVVVVTDEGPGIPPWEHERIFRRFDRLGDHLTRTQGPGLGLPIARALARRLGGDVTVTSDVGRGSHFTLHLPASGPRAVAGPDTIPGAREAG